MSTVKKSGPKAPAIKKELVIQNRLGIHARPAAQFVRATSKYTCEFFVEKDGEKVNGKSIMGLMMLAAGPGSKILVMAEGDDAAAAVREVEGLIAAKFGED